MKKIQEAGLRLRPGQKIYVLDTSTPVHDPNCIKAFKDNIVVIPGVVIEELNNLKRNKDPERMNARYNAREFSRILRSFTEKGNLRIGIETDGGGKLLVDHNGCNFVNMPKGIDKTNDNRIVSVAKSWKEKYRNSQVILVTKDNNVAIMANTVDVICQDYESDKKLRSIEELYSGLLDLQLNGDEDCLIDDLNKYGNLDASKINLPDGTVLNSNHCVRLTSYDEMKYALAIYKKDTGLLVRVKKPNTFNQTIQPLNDEQSFAYALLKDQTIPIVTLAGKAGSGKTLLSLLAGYQQIFDQPYHKMIVYRPIQEVGASLGFLPGEKKEKFKPYTQPIYDNMELVLNGVQEKEIKLPRNLSKRSKRVKFYDEKPDKYCAEDLEIYGQLVIDTIAYISGRSIHNTFIIFDEAQELTPKNMDTCGTRCGKNSKLVLVGNPGGINNPYLGPVSNGLAYLIENLKGKSIYGHITLHKSERSEVAELIGSL